MIQRANDALGLNMGVCLIQSVSHDNTLLQQQGTYTVILRGIEQGVFQSKAERISVVQKIIDGNNREALLNEALNPDLEIILSNTTEAGIVFNDTDRSVDLPAASFPGKLTQLLHHRFNHYPDKPIGIIPCELIERNGDRLKQCVLQFAQHWHLADAFVQYLEANVHFCQTLVDRIIPGYPKNPETFWKELGYIDHALVVGEPYHLWAIEASPWVKEKFPLHQAGLNVIYTEDLEPYRVRKVRILNGIHTAMAAVGLLAGIKTVRDAVKHQLVGAFIRQTLDQEILPGMPGDQQMLKSYEAEVIERFLNPTIDHQLATITLNSLSKFKVRLVPSIKAHVAKHHHVPENIALALAALLVIYGGKETGSPIDVNDDPAAVTAIRSAWRTCLASGKDYHKLAADLLQHTSWWGESLNDIPGLTWRVSHYLESIFNNGMLQTLEDVQPNKR